MPDTFKEILDSVDPEKTHWDKTEKGKIRATFNNAINCFNTMDDLKTIVKHNSFSNEIEIIRNPPWKTRDPTPKSLDDEDLIGIKKYICNTKRIEFTKNTLNEAVIISSLENIYHPVRDYLNGLNWDGVERLDTWLHTYLHADNNEYTRLIGKMTLVAAVARIFRPGIKYDHMLILEGAQGLGKSEVFKILGGEWFAEIQLIDRDKEIVDKMLGVWFGEVAEMASFNKKDIETLKGFLTTSKDKVRLSYDRRSKFFRRQGIFVGTINKEDDIGYFKDKTGNRRFFPVTVGNIDFDGLKAGRDQLFAEAIHAYKEGYKIFIKREMMHIVTKEQEARLEVDPWEEKIKEWALNTIGSSKVKIIHIWERCLGMPAGHINQASRNRISRCLKRLEYINKTFKDDGKVERFYFKENSADSRVGIDVNWGE